MLQGTVSFAGVSEGIVGGTMTFSRGVRPSVCLLRTMPGAINQLHGTLEFRYGAVVIQFPNSAVIENPLRLHQSRDAYQWDVMVVDRRWKWRYARIDGCYNGPRAPKESIRKNARELAQLLLQAMGESNYSLSNIPTDVYPYVNWNRARADLELEWLCDLLGLVPIMQITGFVFFRRLNDPSEGLPAPGGSAVNPTFPWKSSVLPSQLRLQGDPTIVQSKLTLEPVGLDTDGSIKPIDDLSYKPSVGWADTWPEFFSQVDQSNRHLALQSVYRWYRPSAGWDGDGVTIDDASQIELLSWSAEDVKDSNDYYRNTPPQVTGSFWPYCDHAINTSEDAVYNGRFKILPELCVVEFDVPIFKLQNNEVGNPDLFLTAAYRVKKPDNSGYSVYTSDFSVRGSASGGGIRVLNHPELIKTNVKDSIWGDPGDNLTDLDNQSQRYLTGVEETYQWGSASDVVYEGLQPFGLNGAVAQIRWICGYELPALTRVGRHTEFDVTEKHHQQRRAEHRLAQMAERLSL